MSEEGEFIPQAKFVSEVRTNTKSDLIEITEDKLENILLKHGNKLSKVKGWVTPTSLSITILLVLLTTDFKNSYFSISGDVWNAIFIMALIVTFIWSLISGYHAIKCSKKASIDFLIKEIKNTNQD